MATWNTTFNGAPLGNASPSEGDDRIRETRKETCDRVDQEHVFLDTAATGACVHRAGAGVSYCQAAEPTLRPDGLTSLGVSDKGRLWIDTDDENIHYWDGTQWLDVDVATSDLATATTATVADSIEDNGTAAAELYLKVVPIGDWNMDSTADKNVAHGLTMSKIRTASVFVLGDSATNSIPIEYPFSKNVVTAVGPPVVTESISIPGGYSYINSGNIYMARVLGGTFDSTTYDSTSYNRGFIVIWYVA